MLNKLHSKFLKYERWFMDHLFNVHLIKWQNYLLVQLVNTSALSAANHDPTISTT